MAIPPTDGARSLDPRPGSVRTFVHDTRAHAQRALADEIGATLRRAPGAVFGWATGNTPVGLYDELAADCAASRVSFARATSFNLDEYLDLPLGHPHSFAQWMHERLFARIDVPRERAHLPDVRATDPAEAAARYEAAIVRAGGIDLQVLGLGRNGHIGFNEPGSARDSRTRVVTLAATTREDAARTFGSIDAVPRRALTMGVATILEARSVRVLAFGAGKAAIVRALLADPVSSACPATFLRGHPDVQLHVDAEAAVAAGI